MNDPQRAEKLALAKKKLKEFENKRRNGASPGPGVQMDGRCSSLSNGSVHSMDRIDVHQLEREPFMVVNANGGENLQIDRQTNGSTVSSSSINSSVVLTNGTQDDHSTISHTFTSAIEARLIQERDAAHQACEQLKNQLGELHTHYAHLHAAYSQLSASGVHTDMEKQIIQLQSAVSVLVEEKTNLQAELRSAKEQYELISSAQTKAQNENVSFQLEQELRNFKAKLEQSNSLVKAQTAEIENLRKVYAETQAKNLSVQNEKSEAQLRVRALVKDRDALNEELSVIKKDLQMRNLHIKQLSAHQLQTPLDTVATDQIQNLTERLEAMTKELMTVRSEKDACLRETEATRRQFEQYSAELAEKNNNLRQELETAEDQRQFHENRVQELEMQLLHFQKPNEALPHVNSTPIPGHDTSDELQEQLKKIHKLEEKITELNTKLSQERRDFKEENDRQAASLAQKEEELMNLSIKYRQLEERWKESKGNESELLSLSDQLQSEKATVSRAVAQNKELKEQLLETEDRLVAVTNEKMQCELDKQAAEHQVRVLTEQLNQGTGSQVESVPDSTVHEVHEHLETSAVEAMAMKNEREQELEQKLQQAQQELTDVRQELRQSHSRNEQMNQIMMNNAEDENQNSIHVELGQAMERINQLAAENERLREGQNLLEQREIDLVHRLAAAEREIEEKKAEKERGNEEKKEKEPHVHFSIESSSEPEDKKPAENSRESTVIEEQPQPQASRAELIEENDDDQIMEWFAQAHVHKPHRPQVPGITPEEVERWARNELEKKFTDSMWRIAELSEVVDKLEHINVQLQMENETIGDHVILYHQQRRIIRDRLRVKDQQLLTMEAEKQRVLERCRELQSALKEILNSKEAPTTSPAARRAARTYSHSTVDEMSGDEDVVVAPDAPEPVTKSEDVFSQEEGRTSPAQNETDAKVQRIFNILDEISTTPVASAEDVHCSQCTGELKQL